MAVVAIGISGYFGFLLGELGVDLPAWMLGAPGTGAGTGWTSSPRCSAC